MNYLLPGWFIYSLFHFFCSQLSFAGGLDVMRASKSLLQREMEDESSRDDDYFILTAAGIVQMFSGKKRRDSVPGHVVIYRDREGGNDRMFQDYLADNPTYGPHLFRRRLVLIHL